MINPQWLEQLISPTNFHGPKDVQAIEVWLDVLWKGSFLEIKNTWNEKSKFHFIKSVHEQYWFICLYEVLLLRIHNLTLNMRTDTFCLLHPMKTDQPAQSNQSSLSTWRNFTSFAIQNVSSEDSDQTAQIWRLIWIFAGYTRRRVYFLM